MNSKKRELKFMFAFSIVVIAMVIVSILFMRLTLEQLEKRLVLDVDIKRISNIGLVPEKIKVVKKVAQSRKTVSRGSKTYIGIHKITHYDNCIKCCGKTNGITASGKLAKTGNTIAMAGVEFGTRVYIEDYGYFVVEDRGGAIKGSKIDVYVNTHREALEKGVKYKKVYILN